MPSNLDKRYEETKKLGDIIKDMFSVGKKAEQKKNIALKNEEFADSLIHYLNTYNLKMEEMEPLYQQASELINSFDELFLQQKRLLVIFKKGMKNQKLCASTLSTHNKLLHQHMDLFESTYEKIQNTLSEVTSSFTKKEDKEEHELKIKMFSDLFMQIYVDIDQIHDAYDLIIDQLP